MSRLYDWNAQGDIEMSDIDELRNVIKKLGIEFEEHNINGYLTIEIGDKHGSWVEFEFLPDESYSYFSAGHFEDD